MALGLISKEAIVAEVSEVAKKAYAVIASEYSGLTVAEMTDLRSRARRSGVYIRVIKNTLAKRALAETEFTCMQEALKGPLILAFSMEDPGSAARVLAPFAKDHQRLVVKAIGFGGKLLGPSDLERLATLPTKDQAISQLMALMQAPVTKLVRTLAAPPTKLVRTFVALRDQKQAA